jgi:hypothetical protein
MQGRCNGVSNCADGSDELGCDESQDIFVPAYVATETACPTDFSSDVYFQCANTNCIEKVGLCNGQPNCADGSDESHCSASVLIESTTVEATSGKAPTLQTLQMHTTTSSEVFHDRSYHFDSLGDFAGKTFLKYHNDDKLTDHGHVMTKIRVTEPTTVFIVKQPTNALPWLAQEGFARSALTGITFSGQRTTRHKEWDPTLLTTDHFDASEVFSKSFAAGTIILPGNGDGDGAFLIFLEKASASPPVTILPVPVLQNGEFEEGVTTETYQYTSDIPGWTATGRTLNIATANGDWGCSGCAGTHFLGLQIRGASVSQTVSGHIVGRTYHLAFIAAQRTNYNPSGPGAILRVTTNGAELMNEVLSSSVMQRHDFTYTAESSDVDIKFENVVTSGDKTVFLDAVEITEA